MEWHSIFKLSPPCRKLRAWMDYKVSYASDSRRMTSRSWRGAAFHRGG